MCNCGNKRNALHVASNHQAITTAPVFKENAVFEYTGKTALQVRGTVTGELYRFHFMGDKKIIHYKDVGGMQSVPHLKRWS